MPLPEQRDLALSRRRPEGQGQCRTRLARNHRAVDRRADPSPRLDASALARDDVRAGRRPVRWVGWRR